MRCYALLLCDKRLRQKTSEWLARATPVFPALFSAALLRVVPPRTHTHTTNKCASAAAALYRNNAEQHQAAPVARPDRGARSTPTSAPPRRRRLSNNRPRDDLRYGNWRRRVDGRQGRERTFASSSRRFCSLPASRVPLPAPHPKPRISAHVIVAHLPATRQRLALLSDCFVRIAHSCSLLPPPSIPVRLVPLAAACPAQVSRRARRV